MTLAALFNRPSIETSLSKHYKQYIERHPKTRQRDIARALLVSEAMMVDEQLGMQSLKLNKDFGSLIQEFPRLGYIMTLMRNDYAVHERKGIYDNVKIHGKMGLVIAKNKKIDLRLFFSQWEYGYAVKETLKSGERYSLQFFSKAGIAIQKIYLQEESNLSEYENIISAYIEDDQLKSIEVNTATIVNDFEKDDKVNRDELISGWKKMTDVHQFMGLLKKHNVDRQQAFRLVGDEYAEEFSAKHMEVLLEQVVERNIPIMCFVGNQGGIQIHSGKINKVKAMGPWLNILDPEFNLHLLETGITNAWLVRKPTIDGIITSLELYDSQGQQVAQFFGQRKEGEPENLHWKRLAESVLEQCASGHYTNNKTNVA